MTRVTATRLLRPLVLSGLILAAGLILCGCPPKMDAAERLVRDGNDYFKSEDYDKAVDAYSRALNLEPGQPGVLVNRGNARVAAGDPSGALADYEAALEIDPEFANAYANRAILLDQRGETDAAIRDYRKALDLDPKLGDPPGILTRILYNPPVETIRDRLEFLEATRGHTGK